MPPKKTAAKASGSRKKTPKVAKAKTAVKRTVKKAAHNVEVNAERAREVGAAVVRAGEMIEQGAAWLDALALRAESRAAAQPKSSPRKK
ncbi:MAG: hypothetical protein M3Y18_06970 [Candidatus Eremiobacteraeota bacterium]|nr:hypothetical protein [Candidatus Eremiobacteraeota bacterium]